MAHTRHTRIDRHAAIVYCEGAFNTPNGKTAHGLVRFTNRYQVTTVIDSRYAGRDAGVVLDGKTAGVPVVASLSEALDPVRVPLEASHLVVGLAPDGGRLRPADKETIKQALHAGLHVHSGLHDFLSEDPSLVEFARSHNVSIVDVRKPPPRSELHFFTGEIAQVGATKIAVLGTDSAVGKRTTAWLLVHELEKRGRSAELIGTGQTAWMQGARYGLIMDSLVSDFITGEIEHAMVSAWREREPDYLVVEGQGSIMNPAYPGGLEIITSARPDMIVLQHAPARLAYDGFPEFAIHPLTDQIEVVEKLSGSPVVAIAVNHEDIPSDQVDLVCHTTSRIVGVPAFDVLLHGAEGLADTVEHLRIHR